MKTRISATELSRSLSDILNRVHYRGEAFVIERNGEAVAELEPVRTMSPATWRTLLERLRDFALDDPTFADDLEAIQQSQPKVPVQRWPN